MTAEEIYEYKLDQEWLPDDLKRLICQAISRLPEKVQDFAVNNCSYLPTLLPGEFGLTLDAAYFTHLTKRGRAARNHWLIQLSNVNLKRAEGVYTVAHEIAHAYLKHRMRPDPSMEEEADRLVVSWGFDIPAYRKKIHAEHRKLAWQHSQAFLSSNTNRRQ